MGRLPRAIADDARRSHPRRCCAGLKPGIPGHCVEPPPEAITDIDYAICIAEMHARLFGRIKKAIASVGLVGGSAAIYSLVSKNPMAAGVYGIFTAVRSAFDLVYDPSDMAAAHQRDRQAFLDLRSRISKLTLPSIDAELAKVRRGAAICIRSLERLAHRNNRRSHGYSTDHIRLSVFEKLVYWLASPLLSDGSSAELKGCGTTRR